MRFEIALPFLFTKVCNHLQLHQVSLKMIITYREYEGRNRRGLLYSAFGAIAFI